MSVSRTGVVFTSTHLLEFLAVAGNLQSLGGNGKAQLLTDLILDFGDLLALKLDNFLTVLTNDMVVVGMIRVVRIVEFVILTEIHLVNHSAFHQQG